MLGTSHGRGNGFVWGRRDIGRIGMYGDPSIALSSMLSNWKLGGIAQTLMNNSPRVGNYTSPVFMVGPQSAECVIDLIADAAAMDLATTDITINIETAPALEGPWTFVGGGRWLGGGGSTQKNGHIRRWRLGMNAFEGFVGQFCRVNMVVATSTWCGIHITL